MKMSIQFKNIKKVSDKLDPKELYWPQAKNTLKSIGLAGAIRLRADAPSRSHAFLGRGRIRDTISYKVNSIPRPLWVVFKVGATATPKNPGARGGKTKYPFSYPKRLEYEKKNPHYQWAHESLKKSRSSFRAAINNCAKAIEDSWSKT